MKRIEHDLEHGTTEDTLDLVAKTLLLRGGRSTVITWDDLERAADMKCVLVKTREGLTFAVSEPSRSN